MPVELLDRIDSATAHAGDTFRFRTIDTVVAGRRTLPSGSIGYGLVTYASAAGAHGKGGELIVEARYVPLGATPFQVAIDTIASSAVSNGKTGNIGPGVGLVPIPFFGTAVGAFNYLHAGKNVAVEPGYRFTVVPVGDLRRGRRCTM